MGTAKARWSDRDAAQPALIEFLVTRVPEPIDCTGCESRSGQQVTSELKQITHEHRAPCIRVKRFAAAPCATVEAKGALEGRDGRFDTGAKVSERLVGDAVARHLGNTEAEVLAEDDVLHAERANVGEVLSGCEAAVKSDAAWGSRAFRGDL